MDTEYSPLANFSYLPLLRAKEVLPIEFAPGKVVVLRVAKQYQYNFVYSFGKLVDGFAGGGSGFYSNLAAQNLLLPRINTNSLATNSFVQNQRLAVQGVSGVQDLFEIKKDGEAFQFFYGISPRDIRTWLLQPNGVYVGLMDQNLTPFQNTQLVDVGFVDGYSSPFDYPSPKTETIVLDGLDVAFSLCNMMTFIRDPRLNLIINRLEVEPVLDPKELYSALQSRAGFRSISQPFYDSSRDLTLDTYGNPPIVSPDMTVEELAAAVKEVA